MRRSARSASSARPAWTTCRRWRRSARSRSGSPGSRPSSTSRSMAVARDLYALLGVTRDASDADIRTAYRRLARELHPDVNGDPAAETRFKEIAGAYEILSDPEKRARYDAFGDGGGQPFADIGDIFEMFFGQGGFGSRRRGPRSRTRRGEDVGVTLRLSFEEAVFGVRRDLDLERLAVCERCMGNGAEP